jgi:hypothetical protein
LKAKKVKENPARPLSIVQGCDQKLIRGFSNERC